VPRTVDTFFRTTTARRKTERDHDNGMIYSLWKDDLPARLHKKERAKQSLGLKEILPDCSRRDVL